MHHRIYMPELQSSSAEVDVTGPEFHHAARVVRLRQGEEVELFDGRGRNVAGRVTAIERDRIAVRIEGEIPSRESPLQLTLAMAVIQLEKFELVLQKATELGAVAITPLLTDRVEIRAERYRGKHERWEKIIFEAVKQSGRSVLPVLSEPATLDQALSAGRAGVFFDADVEPSAQPLPEEPMTLFIGPEGGWSEREIALAREAGCLFRRLGRRRLRAETAAIVALATTAAGCGEVR